MSASDGSDGGDSALSKTQLHEVRRQLDAPDRALYAAGHLEP